MPPPLQPQQALEQAAVDAILAAPLGYTAPQVGRMFDGHPPPSCGTIFVAVWSTGRRTQGKAGRTALDQVFTLNVTLTARFNAPFDRQVRHRDDVESRLNAIVALLHQDSWSNAIISATNTLAGYRVAGVIGPSPVGFCEGLAWEEVEPVKEVGGEWFLSKQPERRAGLTQTARFGRARHVQNIPTAQ